MKNLNASITADTLLSSRRYTINLKDYPFVGRGLESKGRKSIKYF